MSDEELARLYDRLADQALFCAWMYTFVAAGLAAVLLAILI